LAQSLHVVPEYPGTSLNDPAGHLVHADSPLEDVILPAGHSAQEDCPSVSAKRPIAHSLHVVPGKFSTSTKRPWRHLVHEVKTSAAEPSSAADSVPGGHASQLILAVTLANIPRVHTLHEVPVLISSSLNQPLGQDLHPSAAGAGVKKPRAQFSHCDCPWFAAKRPSPQDVQEFCPFVFVYLPLWHLVHEIFPANQPMGHCTHEPLEEAKSPGPQLLMQLSAPASLMNPAGQSLQEVNPRLCA
jgi:hypothetical protein